MKNEKIIYATSYSNLQDESVSKDLNLQYDLEQDKIKQALLERPRFTVKARLISILLALFLFSALISISAMYMLSKIDIRVQYVFLSDKFTDEIQEVRREEKNYFLFGSDLSYVLSNLNNAVALLNQATLELGHVVGTEEINHIHQYITKYKELIKELISNEKNHAFKSSKRFEEISVLLRNYGSKMLEIAFDITEKEHEQINSTITMANRIQISLLIILLPLSIFLASYFIRHVLKRLNRLMDVTQKFASGDFTPITPTRKYMDEFTHLAIALNNMIYEIEKRQHLLVESHKLRAIGNLTAGVAHELNNPINNIILTAEMLKESYNELPEEECMDMVNDLVIQGERAHKIVNNLLDFARESETKSEYIYIDKLINETIQLAKNQIKLSNIQVETTIDENLQPLYCDRKLLIQVFLNLFINAIDAMPDGGNLSIKVTGKHRTGFISIQISDTGCGIPQHILNSIFNPFFTTKPTSKGTGLGLSVSKGIIEQHGGDIVVISKVNEGTTFTVHLPIVSIPADIKRNHSSKAQ
jgi:two-component system, NtrC family, sensor kinase